MKNYFIGQGTHIVAQFATMEEMLDFHSKMSDLDRHFCKVTTLSVEKDGEHGRNRD